MPKIIPNLWFDSNAEEAVNFYVSVFPGSKIKNIARYLASSEEVSGKPKGTVMSIEFELSGHPFIAINGGPEFKFSPAVSLMIECEDQKEVDYYWGKLIQGGDEKNQICGWLSDKYGLSWQVTPRILEEMIRDKDEERAERVMSAMLKMKKIIIADLEKAYEGK